ncbi:MAG: PRC-barrel domain-containing protein [Actinomycetota bacterium]|nr:PRC-barrel domain-containing protein [Actinomycetota bacterium]
MSTSTAESVGQVADFVIDPQSRSIVALTVKNTPHGDTVLWPSISAFGADAVTVAGAEALIDANGAVAALSGKDQRLLGKRVLDTAGADLGAVSDVEFDPDTGALIALTLASGAVGGGRLIGMGSYAVVVHAGA